MEGECDAAKDAVKLGKTEASARLCRKQGARNGSKGLILSDSETVPAATTPKTPGSAPALPWPALEIASGYAFTGPRSTWAL